MDKRLYLHIPSLEELGCYYQTNTSSSDLAGFIEDLRNAAVLD